MTTNTRLTKFLLILAVGTQLFACGEGVVSGSGDDLGTTQQNLGADDLYARLRAAENLVQPPPPTETVLVGTIDARYGTFQGLSSWWDHSGRKPRQIFPITSIGGIQAVLVFNVNYAYGSTITLTANGKTVTSNTGSISLNVGSAKRVDWSLSVGSYTRADSLNISYPVVGVGAFTVSALPMTIAYEPPMNLARTNATTLNYRQEMTVITGVSKSSSSSRQSFASQGIFRDLLDRAQPRFASSTVRTGIDVIKGLLGSSSTTVTTGTTVNSDSTLGLTHFSETSYTTNALLGPGLGDVIVFYKNPRLAWLLLDGEVTLTMLDRGQLMMVTVDMLRNDLAAARAGIAAPVTGLDAVSLEALIRLDPMATTRIAAGDNTNLNVSLPTPRFRYDTSLTINGVSFTQTVGHTITQTDASSTLQTTTRVNECHSGWLSSLGIGETQNGIYTTTTSMGTSRTESTSTTAAAQLRLAAGATEAYTIDVYYDALFGSFLARKPASNWFPGEIGP